MYHTYMKKLVPTDAILIPPKATCAFHGIIYDVFQWQQQLFDGSHTTFEMLRRPDTVETIAIIDSQVLVIDEDQPHRGRMVRFPGGRVDVGETPLAAAQRELLEETGYSLSDWKLLAVRQPHSKMEWFIYTYVAWGDVHQVTARPDAGEHNTTRLVSFNELQDLAQQNVGDPGRNKGLLEGITTSQELLSRPAFIGQEIERA